MPNINDNLRMYLHNGGELNPDVRDSYFSVVRKAVDENNTTKNLIKREVEEENDGIMVYIL